ncbi:MAG TPA: glycine betaine ABC transporter substrate-binding protein [Bryobacteraceae bacterium]|nr:glycine betaine ABC transporter substrate-binding protein [Bryobacteraceae bacterium]
MPGLRFSVRLPKSARVVAPRVALCVALCAALCTALLLSACQRKKPIVIGTKSGSGQILLGEIVAQHLEARLTGVKIERRPGTGGTPILFQAIAGGEITIYPESTGVIATSILKEPPSPDPAVVLERARLEMARIAQLDLLELGFEDGPAMVIPAGGDGGEITLSQAAQGKARWKVAMTPDFEQSADFQALNRYHLPLAAPLRSLEAAELFDALAQGGVNMVVTTASDGHLTTPQWKVLQDDKKAFPAQQVCLLVRQDRLAGEPGLRPALEELYGKMTLDAMRKLNHQIEIDHTDVAAVARQFLASVGLR